MPCDPQVLVRESVCIQCGIPSGMQSAVLISLLCQIRDNGGTGGPAVWGGITGLLSNQADLVAALAAANAPDLIVDNINLDQAVPYNAAHGLGSTPSMVRGVIRVTASVPPFASGDEFSCEEMYDDNGTFRTKCGVGANNTNVWFSISPIFSLWTDPTLLSTSGGASPVSTTIVGKLYVWK